jgi:hypothetical protein
MLDQCRESTPLAPSADSKFEACHHADARAIAQIKTCFMRWRPSKMPVSNDARLHGADAFSFEEVTPDRA